MPGQTVDSELALGIKRGLHESGPRPPGLRFTAAERVQDHAPRLACGRRVRSSTHHVRSQCKAYDAGYGHRYCPPQQLRHGGLERRTGRAGEAIINLQQEACWISCRTVGAWARGAVSSGPHLMPRKRASRPGHGTSPATAHENHHDCRPALRHNWPRDRSFAGNSPPSPPSSPRQEESGHVAIATSRNASLSITSICTNIVS